MCSGRLLVGRAAPECGLLLQTEWRGLCARPRRRQFEAFATDARIIRLIRRRVALFPTAAER